jgi:hypothetical protein
VAQFEDCENWRFVGTYRLHLEGRNIRERRKIFGGGLLLNFFFSLGIASHGEFSTLMMDYQSPPKRLFLQYSQRITS